MKTLLLFLFTFSFSVVKSQTWEVGGFAGGSGYMGDLNQVQVYKFTDFAYGGQIKRNFNGYLSLRLNVMRGKIQADDSKSSNAQFQARNLSFFSPLTEVGIQVEYNFFSYIPSISKKLYTPFVFTGIGQAVFNPQADFGGTIYQLNLYGTEGQDIAKPYKKSALSIPYGAGVKYNFAGQWTMITEVGYRTAFSDFLDDVSGRYPDKALLVNSTAVALSDRTGEATGVYLGILNTQRGDFRKRDSYMFAGISLTYTFLSRKCPVVE